MQLILNLVTKRTLVRFLSASAVRIALSATLTTPQPAVALQAVFAAEQSASTVLAAGPADRNDGAAESREGQERGPRFGEPGAGWA
jgi:hypothetical protein